MKLKDPTIYEARFSRLRLHAFGIPQILAYTETVQVYQARANPELWRARPVFNRGPHRWEAMTPIELMTIIENDWCDCLIPWHKTPQSIEQTVDDYFSKVSGPRRRAG
ncbi:MAG TPA: hypothetical protein VKT75_05760 [Acidobacteriaceae bacterium]|nr:hypothetical protein [Acidobacteriaceae bacterium]